MKILIDIGHPAHVHLFKNFAWEMQKRSNEIFFTCRDNKIEIHLLRTYGFQFKSIGKKYKSLFGKVIGLFEFSAKLFLVGLKFKPDLFLSGGSMYSAYASKLMGKPYIALEDTGNIEQVILYKPFAKYILTPSVFPSKYGKKQIKYNGYHELAYLHPNYLKTNDDIFNFLQIHESQKFALLRFSSWEASHDILKKGISDKLKFQVIDLLKNNGLKVFISSENTLPKIFDEYQINIPPEKIFDVMYYSDLVIADSQTMVAEAALLGTPAIRCNELVGSSHGYHHEELEHKYGLIFNFHTRDEKYFLKKIKSIVDSKDYKIHQQKKIEKLLSDKIDVTSFLVSFIENRFK